MRFFNTAGPCDPAIHYTLPPAQRLPEVGPLVDEQSYFVVHAPRQVGKTTTLRSLARELTTSSRYAAVHASCESAEAAGSDLDEGIAGICWAIHRAAERQLDEDLRPAAPTDEAPAVHRLIDFLSAWSGRAARPVVLFLDEIDSLQDAVLISVLRQLRSGYPDRPRHFPRSVALVGLRDVRDYRLQARPDGESLGTSSPFNIKVESLRLPDFDADDVAALYAQHAEETGQRFTDAAVARAFERTRGQPWLVNALARTATRDLVPDRSVSIDADTIARAEEILIQRRDTHLDSLIHRLREPRVRRVIEPILAGEFLSPDVLDDDVTYAVDLGLLARSGSGLSGSGLEIANPIYREVIPRALTHLLEADLPTPEPAAHVDAEGGLRFSEILESFRGFWRRHAESFLRRAPYSEAAAQLVFMAWLHKLVNGGGTVEREYAVGSGRLDLCVRWPRPDGTEERYAVELKVWRRGRPDPLAEGLDQLALYLDRLDLETGTLLIFDDRPEGGPGSNETEPEVVEKNGRRITVFRL